MAQVRVLRTVMTTVVAATTVVAVGSGMTGAWAGIPAGPRDLSIVGPAVRAASLVADDPQVLWEETFGDGDTVVALEDYIGVPAGPAPGAPPTRYTADPYWLSIDACNGMLVGPNSAMPSPTACVGSYGEFAGVMTKASALGNLTGTSATNRALSSNTTSGVGLTAGQIQLATVGQIQLPGASGRFITFSVDAAASGCTSAPPLLRFYLRDSANTEIPVSDSPINPCQDARYSTFLGVAKYDRFPSDSSILIDDTSIGIVLRNEQSTANGNDGAIDNIRIIDVTPRVVGDFASAVNPTGATTTLTLTVVNTSDLAAKDGWEFSQQLPAGVVVAGAPGGTCAGSATASGSLIAVTGGSLPSGTPTCTVTVPVTSSTGGLYTLPEPVTLGLDTDVSPSVAFSSFTVETTVDRAVVHPGESVTVTTRVRNTGGADYSVASPAAFTQSLAGFVDDASVVGSPSAGSISGGVLSWSGPLAVGAEQVITVTFVVGDDGDGQLTSTVSPGGSGGSCGPCSAAAAVGTFTVETTVDRESTVPGQQVTYEVTVANTGVADYDDEHPAAFSEDLSEVIDDAVFDGTVDIQRGTAARAAVPAAGQSSDEVSWSGPLAAGEVVVVTFVVTPDGGGRGDALLVATVTPTAAGGTCVERCSTRTVVDLTRPAVHTGGAAAPQGDPAFGLLALVLLSLAAASGALAIAVVRRDRERRKGE